MSDTGAGDHYFLAGTGDDTIHAGATHANIFAGPGDDTIYVTYDGTTASEDAIETISCGSGFDTVQVSGVSDPSLRAKLRDDLTDPLLVGDCESVSFG